MNKQAIDLEQVASTDGCLSHTMETTFLLLGYAAPAVIGTLMKTTMEFPTMRCGRRLLQQPGLLTAPLIVGTCSRRGLASAEPNLYEVLGVTPRASSKHIKAAYFRLSKKYHPDRQSGDAVKFQQISAAYEVLGNRHRRRAYDSSRQHGHRHGAPRHGPAYHAPPATGARSTPHTGRTAHYDYDAWSESHYQELRRRENKSRHEYAIANEKRRDRREERTRGFIACTIIVIMAAYVGFLADDDSGPSSRRPPR